MRDTETDRTILVLCCPHPRGLLAGVEEERNGFSESTETRYDELGMVKTKGEHAELSLRHISVLAPRKPTYVDSAGIGLDWYQVGSDAAHLPQLFAIMHSVHTTNNCRFLK